MPYRLLIDFAVLEFAFRLSKSHQRQLFAHFVATQYFPGNYSDFAEVDEATGRTLNVSVFGDYQIRSGIDDADKHIKILRMSENE